MDKKGQHTLLGIFSYLGPLVIVSLIMAKNDQFVKFHVKQGLVLFIIEVINSALLSMLWLFFIPQLVNLGVIILAIIGMINFAHHREKELPVIGHLAKHFTF